MRKVHLAAALLVASVSSPSWAAILTMSFNGFVRDGRDFDNLFGGGDLTDKPFTTRFAIDTDIDQREQDFQFDSFRSVRSATLTIGGKTAAFNNSYYTAVGENAGFGSNGIFGQVSTDEGYFLSSQITTKPFNSNHVVVTIADLTLPFSYTAQYEDAVSGTLSRNNNGIQLQIENVTLTNSAVPEPATWTMTIGGIGIAGGMMRRRKVNVRVAYA